MVIKLLKVIRTRINMCKLQSICFFISVYEGRLVVCLIGGHVDIYKMGMSGKVFFVPLETFWWVGGAWCWSYDIWSSVAKVVDYQTIFWLKIKLNRRWKLDGNFFHLIRSMPWARSHALIPWSYYIYWFSTLVYEHYITPLQGRAKKLFHEGYTLQLWPIVSNKVSVHCSVAISL
jgi:hypothetical protein